MLYTKQIEQITWEDILEFCNQKIPEGTTLDYKQDFPKNLHKTIAAFANTIGGIILIGIEEDDDNKPILPLKGITFERGLSERVYNIVLTNVTPPTFPEINVCKNSEGDKAIIVIRVHQSHQTPHAINDNTQVYLRTGNRNNFEVLAKIDEVFWLNNHRQKSLELREFLIKETEERFNKIIDINRKKIIAERAATKFINPECWLKLIITPIFPKETFTSPPELKNKLENFFVFDYFQTSDEFPITESRFNNPFSQDSVILKAFWDTYAYYTEYNVFGLFYYRQNLLEGFNSRDGEPKKIFRLNEVLARLDQFIDSAQKFYRVLGYNGYIRFIFSIQNPSEYALISPSGQYTLTTFENKIDYQIDLSQQIFYENRIDIIFDCISRLTWAYNINVSKEFVEKYYEKNKR